MKRALLIVAVLAACSLAVFIGVKYNTPATAGMSTITDMEMDGVHGQTGIHLEITGLNVESGNMAWEDKDGFTGAGATGAVILSGVSTPTFMFTADIDVGTTAAGTSYLSIDPPAIPAAFWNPLFGVSAPGGANNLAPLIYGDFSVNDVIIGDGVAATAESLGKFSSQNFVFAVEYIRIAGH
ncbi:MAG: hypothetical protein KKA60_03580 [Proteobacteria bacterium]|nr:hypothetical protein [Pseudomonadota bacterium]